MPYIHFVRINGLLMYTVKRRALVPNNHGGFTYIHMINVRYNLGMK